MIGGIGNQLFQYAAARSISYLKGVPIKVDTSFYDLKTDNRFFSLHHFNTIIIKAQKEEIDKLIAKTSSSFYARILKRFRFPTRFYKKTHIIENSKKVIDKRITNCNNDAFIEGWFQNEMYFKGIRDVLLKEFTLKNDERKEFQEARNKIINCESVSIHFRRGDYLTNKYFGPAPLDYYYRAIKYINERVILPVYYIFSDEIDWVKKNFKIEGNFHYLDSSRKNLSIHPTENDSQDLMLMKQCKYNIVANSTFSWWAAWLNTNPEKIIIAPKKWYDDPSAQKSFERGRLKVPGWIYL